MREVECNTLQPPQICYYLFGIGCLEDITATHEHIYASLNKPRGRVLLHTAIHFYQHLALRLVYHLAQSFHLINSVFDECLSAKARIDTHEQHHINIAYHIF